MKRPGDDPEVRVRCFGQPLLHVINTQLHALRLAGIEFQP